MVVKSPGSWPAGHGSVAATTATVRGGGGGRPKSHTDTATSSTTSPAAANLSALGDRRTPRMAMS